MNYNRPMSSLFALSVSLVSSGGWQMQQSHLSISLVYITEVFKGLKSWAALGFGATPTANPTHDPSPGMPAAKMGPVRIELRIASSSTTTISLISVFSVILKTIPLWTDHSSSCCCCFKSRRLSCREWTLTSPTLLIISGSMRVELVQKHDPRFNENNTNKTELECIKEFAHRDSIRYSMISQRREGKSHSHSHRRKARETFFVMPIQRGRDFRIGEYFVQVKVGTPAQKFWLIADTVSDLTWFNCRHGCGRNCSTHKGRSKIKNRRVFLPERSATIEKVACSSDTCQVQLNNLFSRTICPNPSDPC
ncbi:aspartyl protease family protein 2 [Quillaja saponaria]|uniref:Aspartyl protease family protein 2 n=1 Tax=Quillaja saponaria TaxID=32244 RepID=A0AAD7QJN6_QUISA|nr:aspartyl protease family protein 2 [Quillaja saponaria]